MDKLSKNSPLDRWLMANKDASGFDSTLKRLLGFACAEWIRRGSGRVVSPDEAVALFLAANLPEYPVGLWLEAPTEHGTEIAEFCEKTKLLELPPALNSGFPDVLDMRGVPCPKNSARCRLVLSGAPEGTHLTIYLDEGSPIENVPGSLIADGHIIENREKKGKFWVLSVVKGRSIV